MDGCVYVEVSNCGGGGAGGVSLAMAKSSELFGRVKEGKTDNEGEREEWVSILP